MDDLPRLVALSVAENAPHIVGLIVCLIIERISEAHEINGLWSDEGVIYFDSYTRWAREMECVIDLFHEIGN
jgi:hypothetical protein